MIAVIIACEVNQFSTKRLEYGSVLRDAQLATGQRMRAAAIAAAIYFAAVSFMILPAICWIRDTRPRIVSGLSLAVVVFVTIISVFCYLEATGNPSFDEDLAWFCSLSSIFVTLVLCLLDWGHALASKLCQAESSSAAKWLPRFATRFSWTIASVAIAYAITWCFLHSSIWLNPKDLTTFNNAEPLKEALAAEFSEAEVAEALSQGDCDFFEFANRMMSKNVTPEDNVIFQLAEPTGIISTQYFSEDELIVLGFRPTEVKDIQSNSLRAWLAEKGETYSEPWGYDPKWSTKKRFQEFAANGANHHISMSRLVPFRATDFPLIAQYCDAKQQQFQAIREASKCTHCFSPAGKETFTTGTQLIEKACDMLLCEAFLILGEQQCDFIRATENLEAIHRLSELNKQNLVVTEIHFFEIDDLVRNLAQHIVTRPDAPKRIVDRVLNVIKQSRAFEPYSESRQRSLVFEMEILNATIFQKEYIYDSVDRFTAKYPNAVDWNYFFKLRLSNLDSRITETKKAFEQLRISPSSFRSTTKSNEPEIEDDFRRQIVGLGGSPRTKAAYLAEQEGYFYMSPEIQARRYAERVVRRIRLPNVEIAMQVFKSENGAFPASLDELTDLLPPDSTIDPFSGKPFIYHPDGVDYLPYSVGRNGIDDGGDEDWDDLSYFIYDVNEFIELFTSPQ